MSNLQIDSSSNEADPQFSLLANSLDFIVSAAEYASRDEQRNWKYAVLHLWHGMELLLKARLAREHWSLLFRNIDQADQSKLFDGDFKSVDSDQAHKRLTQICSVELDPNDWKHLVRLRNRSNRIKHHVGEYSSIPVKAMVWKCMNIAITFCQSQQMLDDSSAIRTQVYQINALMQEFDDFVDERLNSIASYPDFVDGLECMECWQEACTMDHNGITCQFCGMEIDAETLNQWMADLEQEVPNGEDETVAYFNTTPY